MKNEEQNSLERKENTGLDEEKKYISARIKEVNTKGEVTIKFS